MFLSIISTLLEILSLGLVFPLISILVDKNVDKLDLGFLKFEFNEFNNFEFLILITVFFVFLIKFLFFLFYIFYQTKNTYNVSNNISKNLFQKYLFYDYLFFLKKNSSELVRNVVMEPDNFIKKVYTTLLQIIMDILILIGIFLLLFWIDPYSSSIVFLVFGSVGLIYFFFFKKKISKIGYDHLKYSKLKLKSSQETFLGIKTIKTYLKEILFFDIFKDYYERSANLIRIQSIIQQIPRHLFELIAISSVIFTLVILIDQKKDFSRVFPLLALYGAATFRILPAINRLVVNNVQLRAGVASQNNLYAELNSFQNKIVAYPVTKNKF